VRETGGLHGWWTRLKRRPTCQHDWQFVRRYEVPDSEGGLVTRMRPVFVYRCRLCGAKTYEDQ
jgi:hypothetical protein